MQDSTRPDSRADHPTIGGVPLIQYAAVVAALGEAFPLREILAVECLDAAKWAEAEPLWKARLVEDAAALAHYGARLAEAEDRLARKVDPLDGDLEAWVEFLRAWSMHHAPMELLGESGLRMNDLARLRRRWEAKMEADSGLVDRAAKLRRRTSAPRLARIAAAPSVLKPSPVAPMAPGNRAASAAPAAAAASARGGLVAAPAEEASPALGIEELAAMLAELDANKNDRLQVYRRFGIATALAGDAIVRDLEQRMARDAVLRSDVRVLRAHHARRRDSRSNQPPTPVPRAEASMSASAPAQLPPGTASAQVPPASMPARMPAPSPLPSAGVELQKAPNIERTADALPAIGARPLPFASPPLPAPLPFARPPSSAAMVLSAPRPSPPPPRRPSRDARDETAELPAIAAAAHPILPFKTVAKPEGAAMSSHAQPTLTLEQYASLSAELAVCGTGRPAVLKRYGFESEEARKLEDQRWALRMHKNDELKVRYKGLLASFRVYLERFRTR